MSIFNANYSKDHPFYSSIKERYNLCKQGSHKRTDHVVLDLKGSNITYKVGDSIGIFPENSKDAVEEILSLLKNDENEKVFDRFSNNTFTIKELLSKKRNLCQGNRKFLTKLDKDFELLKEENRESLRKYLEEFSAIELLKRHPCSISAQEVADLLNPMLPRFYSISSSQLEVGDEVHLTVSMIQYEQNGKIREGICSKYLCETAPLHQKNIPIYVQSGKDFTLPANPEIPIIMVGPGTGIAPFRAFMQERISKKTTGKNWLFFGECHEEYHFFYEEFWKKLEADRQLYLDVAFSRDQEHKVYVQHKMLQKGKEIFDWLESGAIFYVCGDAKKMARDVESTLLQIINEHGGYDDLDSKGYLKKLRVEKRYLRDVY